MVFVHWKNRRIWCKTSISFGMTTKWTNKHPNTSEVPSNGRHLRKVLSYKGVPPPPFSTRPIFGQTSWRPIVQKRPPPPPPFAAPRYIPRERGCCLPCQDHCSAAQASVTLSVVALNRSEVYFLREHLFMRPKTLSR